jgi:ankyrin repeat protein
MWAAAAGGSSMIDLLFLHGADPKLVNEKGQTAVDFAPNRDIKKQLSQRSR